MKSSVQQLGRVRFPEFTGERVYMQEFTKKGGLPKHLKRWQDTVDAMLEGIECSASIFLMIDQAPVKAMATQRRPGVHIDGIWEPGVSSHSPGRPEHVFAVPGHKMWPKHVTVPTPASPWRTVRPGHAMLDESELLVLASNVLGCDAYEGEYNDTPGKGGDCSHFDLSRMQRVDMEPGIAWAGDTMQMLHESIPVRKDCLRTVVRLNVQGAMV